MDASVLRKTPTSLNGNTRAVEIGERKIARYLMDAYIAYVLVKSNAIRMLCLNQ